ncbi:succinate-semialdehyde dehydrogenase/glutarate-semialdehyde dehydrogenase [Runella defluvii]|uniref:Succinate-semialdehyde dehydrogenase/glutarate-semialdehyde dehydrogenase n=1 Tax=Runella defluvii TaxID=370973 RepID=A0A7W5ZS39_9BACT|nr:aldehyde dehydrogenase family protein [Runella defluvii]MBB3842124.1 succinate-semialdehyde dehydrogenase/glutarate-semialdehyde dehydrogenase [Runella defluvii]
MNHFINNNDHVPDSGQYIEVLNPCTAEVVGRCARGNGLDVNFALESAQKAFRKWKKQPTAQRVKLQHAVAQLMRKNAEELGGILANELGRPIAGCIHEIGRSADLLDFYAEEALRLKGEIPLHNLEGEKALVVREPIGVMVSITPFNYPITLLCMKIGAALPVGCTVVAKPSEDTPLSTLRLAELFKEAGYPEGVLNVITGYGHEIGNALIEHPITSKVAFTGGTATGKRIGALAASLNKRITLELGGQSPVIVCEDADLAIACPAIVKHAFANSGQFCYRVNRMYVHATIYEQFVEQIVKLTQKIKVGFPFDGVDMGPLVNQKIYQNSELQVADALNKGATVRTGGKRLTGEMYDRGWFFPPTVIADANPGMKIMTEETFGPVVGVMKFSTIDEAISLANDSDYGLAAYVFSQQLGTGLRIAEELEAGSVWVNNIHRSYQDVPFGGVKQSGVGREKGHYGLEAYTELKTIYLNY